MNRLLTITIMSVVAFIGVVWVGVDNEWGWDPEKWSIAIIVFVVTMIAASLYVWVEGGSK